MVQRIDKSFSTEKGMVIGYYLLNISDSYLLSIQIQNIPLTCHYHMEYFEFVPPTQSEIETIKNNNSICPKCSKEMIKKQTDQYGLIDKCPNCGYC